MTSAASRAPAPRVRAAEGGSLSPPRADPEWWADGMTAWPRHRAAWGWRTEAAGDPGAAAGREQRQKAGCPTKDKTKGEGKEAESPDPGSASAWTCVPRPPWAAPSPLAVPVIFPFYR